MMRTTRARRIVALLAVTTAMVGFGAGRDIADRVKARGASHGGT